MSIMLFSIFRERSPSLSSLAAGAAVWSSHSHHCKLLSSIACSCQQFRQLSSCSKLRLGSAAAQSESADSSTQPKQCRQYRSQCPTWPLKHSQQPCTNVALPFLHSLHRRSWHSLMTAPTTTAADAPGLSNLQGLLHVYKQSLANVGRDAVEQLRHTLAPSEDDDLHDEDTGWAAAAVREQLNTAPVGKVQELTLQQLSVALSAYVASNIQPPARVLQQVGQRLEQVLKKEFDADDITTAINSLAFFGVQASETLIEAIRASLTRTYFARITPHQLGTLMLAIAELGHRNSKLLDGVAREVVDRVEEFSPVSLSEIMWSFAVLGHRHNRMVDVVTQSLLFRLDKMPVAAMSQIICAFAVMKHKDAVTDVFLDAVSDEALKKVDAFEGGDMANMMWAYASLGHWSYVDADWIDAVVARMLRVHKELKASSMVNVVWALAKTDYAGNGNRRSRTLLDIIAKSAMSQMDAFTPEQLSRLLWAFSTLHHYHEDLYNAIAAETMQQVDSFLPCHLADMVSAYANMVHHPGPLLDQMTQRILPKLETMDAGALCNVLWAHGVLQTLTPELFDKICEVLEAKPLAEYKPHDFERAFHAELLLEADLEAKQREDVRKLPKWIRQYAYRAWQDRIYFDRNVTWFQQEVCRSLIELGVNFELEKFLADGCHTVDIVLRIPGKPRLGVNMDPPQRFSSNRPYRPLAEAVCQRRLLAAQGWDMITLPQHEWRRNVSQKERAVYLEKLLDCTLEDTRDSLRKINNDSDASAACRKAAVEAAAAAARAVRHQEYQ